MEKRNKNLLLLASLSWLCLWAGWLLPPLLFLWFPVFLRFYSVLRSDGLIKFTLFTVGWLVIGCSAIKLYENQFGWITLLQSTALSLPFLLYKITEDLVPGRFQRFGIVIYWFAIQYIFIVFFPSSSLFMLAQSLPEEWVRWNYKIGFMGGSLWILVTGLLIAETFMANGTNWRFLVLSMLAILTPIFISLNMTTEALVMVDLLRLYNGGHVVGDYSGYGEVVPRTAAWISVLLLIFTAVKAKTKTSR